MYLNATITDAKTLREFLAGLASAVGLWANHRSPTDPVEDVTAMIRQPMRWSLRHPLRAARRFYR
jgi:hypothetical protein